MTHKFVPILTALVLLLAASCCCCGTIEWTDWDWDVQVTPGYGGGYQQSTPTPSPTPGPTPTLAQDPPGDIEQETEALLLETYIPVRDLHELAIRLRGLPDNLPKTRNAQSPPDYEVGTRRLFHASNVDTDEQFEIYATLAYKTAHVYMWVEEGVEVKQSRLEAAAELFEQQTYPTNREFFGSEWTPGVDNDPHVSILHARNLGDFVAGYYSSADEFISDVRSDSNEMEMFYINVENVTINNDFYNGVLAHEFQHMIHWYNDRNEDTWLNEGFSELAMFLNDFDPGGHDWSFAMEPDTQLNTWPEGPSAGPNYGAGYLFTSYFLDRFGSDATKALVAHEENGLPSVDAVLNDLDESISHRDLFGDWLLANLLDDPSIGNGRYGYSQIDPPSPSFAAQWDLNQLPVQEQATVSQYGTDYIEIRSDTPVRLTFEGSTQVQLVDTEPHSGEYMWWSNRGDDSDMTLTRSFDLSGIEEATLEFWTWYDIEEDWDYAYVEVSTDGGNSWDILPTPSGTLSNPNGNSFGWGYTGMSGGGDEPEWIQERVDLSDYVGQEVLVRFEYVTDDGVNRPGFVLDDISIPELNYTHDGEMGTDGWEAAGFIRNANLLTQRWLVQTALVGPETTVDRYTLDEANPTGEWIIPLDAETNQAVITISGLSPVTTEPARYNYTIEQP